MRPGRTGSRPGREGALFLALLCVLAMLPPADARKRLSEVEVRAGFVYNFARFVEWPPGALPGDSQPFVIAVLGDRELARALSEGLAGKQLRGHDIVVREAHSPADLDGAHLAWIGNSWRDRLREILDRVGNRPVLTVSGIEGFAGSGGIIELYRLGTKFRFSIDEQAAARHGLRISSRLLSLARPRPASPRGRRHQ